MGKVCSRGCPGDANSVWWLRAFLGTGMCGLGLRLLLSLSNTSGNGRSARELSARFMQTERM